VRRSSGPRGCFRAHPGTPRQRIGWRLAADSESAGGLGDSDIRAGGAWQGSIAQDPLDCFLDVALADDLATSFVVEAPPGSGIEFIIEADRDNGVIRLRAYQPSARPARLPPTALP
jgi:hypothetical protein